MKNKYCWLIVLFAFLFVGSTAVRAQKRQPVPQKPKSPPIVRTTPPAPAATRSADISSTDFENKKTPDSAKLKGETADSSVREPRRYVRRCKKYTSKITKRTYRRCRTVKIS